MADRLIGPPRVAAAEVKKKVMSGLVSAAGNLYKRRPKHIQAKVDIAAGGTCKPGYCVVGCTSFAMSVAARTAGSRED